MCEDGERANVLTFGELGRTAVQSLLKQITSSLQLLPSLQHHVQYNVHLSVDPFILHVITQNMHEREGDDTHISFDEFREVRVPNVKDVWPFEQRHSVFICLQRQRERWMVVFTETERELDGGVSTELYITLESRYSEYFSSSNILAKSTGQFNLIAQHSPATVKVFRMICWPVLPQPQHPTILSDTDLESLFKEVVFLQKEGVVYDDLGSCNLEVHDPIVDSLGGIHCSQTLLEIRVHRPHLQRPE